MSTISLSINRDKAYVGTAMPCRIIINGTEIGKLKTGKSMSCELPNAQSSLKVSMVGNFFAIHKIEKEVVLFPQYCKTGVIKCKIKAKINWIGCLSFGLLQAMVRTELEIEYC